MPQCHLHFFDVFFFSAVSFSTSSFLCLFCVPPRFFRALLLISAALALSTFFLSFCAVSSTSASFSTISSSAFSTSLKSVSIPVAFSSSRIFALNLSLKSVYRSLTDHFITLNWGYRRLFRLFAVLSQIWPLAFFAPFFALSCSRTRISCQRQLSFCSVHSMLVLKIKKMLTLISFLFVLHVVCLGNLDKKITLK